MAVNRKCKRGWGLVPLMMMFLIRLPLVSAADQRSTSTNSYAIRETNHISLSITTNYYRFGGTNHTQLRAAMMEARPWKKTEPFDAKTKWQVNSHYGFHPDAGQFVVDSVEVKTKVVITLPWWIPGKPVPRDLVDRWNKCFIGLSTHEQGHRVLAEAAGAEVRNRLLSLPACPSVQELAAAADRAIAETLGDFRERERKYDAVTRHGFTQGAIFPMRPGSDQQFSLW
jgi:predicted secreted Zn-dependent protease